MEVTNGFEPLNNSFAACPLKPLEFVTIMVGQVGVEPTVNPTSRIYSPLQSPLCLLTHIICVLAAVSGFEPNLCESKSHVLPLHYTAICCMERITGFEPVHQRWQRCMLTVKHHIRILLWWDRWVSSPHPRVFQTLAQTS